VGLLSQEHAYVNDQDVRYLQKQAPVLSHGDTISPVCRSLSAPTNLIVGRASHRPGRQQCRRMPRFLSRCCL